MSSFYMRFISICLLGIAISSSPASAWWQAPATPPGSPPKTEPAAKPKAKAPESDRSKAGEDPQAKTKAKTKADRAAKARTARASVVKNRKGKPKLEMNPDAKWVCDQPTAKLEPVWRSEETLVFPFSIRNEGTADLKIRAKGG